MIYYSKRRNDDEATEPPKKTKVEPILFLSKLLNEVETRYWLIELELARLMWVIRKIRYMVETLEKPTRIYTDHVTIVGIVRQSSLNTISIEKFNLRLIRASKYLKCFRLEVRYKPNRTHVIPDALSQLASREARTGGEKGVLNTLHAEAKKLWNNPILTITLSEIFKKRLLKRYEEDPKWKRVKDLLEKNNQLKEDGNAAVLPYDIQDGLIYYIDTEENTRLCIPDANNLIAEVFQMAHDDMGHPRYSHTYERIVRGLYIRQPHQKLHEFIKHCPTCQLNQTLRHHPYESL